MNLTVLVICHREPDLLRDCLARARSYAGEIVVGIQTDPQPTDLLDMATIHIAMQFADRVFTHPIMGSCEFSRGQGMALASHPWILALDADEYLSPTGVDLVQATLASGVHAAFGLRRLTTVGDVVQEDAIQWRLLQRADWDGIHWRMHAGLHPRAGLPFHPLPSLLPAIIHAKTPAMQDEREARYAAYGYLSTELRPEWTAVPWHIIWK